MDQLAEALQGVYAAPPAASRPASTPAVAKANGASTSTTPFALVNGVAPDSPAAVAVNLFWLSFHAMH